MKTLQIALVPLLVPLCSRGATIPGERENPRTVKRKERGAFEKIPSSGIWWVRYKENGVEHREKVGRRSDAINLYRIRKADILRGAKMPANMGQKGIKFFTIAQDAIDWYENHDRKDVRNFKSRMRTA